MFPDRVGFHHRKDFPKAETPPPSPGGSDVAARMMWLHDHVVEGASSPVSHLDEWREKALSERHTMVGITSCSVPANKQFQSTCGWALQHGQTEWIHRTVAGRFRTPDAELTAIRFAVESAVIMIPGVTVKWFSGPPFDSPFPLNYIRPQCVGQCRECHQRVE